MAQHRFIYSCFVECLLNIACFSSALFFPLFEHKALVTCAHASIYDDEWGAAICLNA